MSVKGATLNKHQILYDTFSECIFVHAICKQLHQSTRNALWTTLHTYQPGNIDQINNVMDSLFVFTTYASKVAVDCTLNMSPGALFFQSNMILNIPVITDFFTFMINKKLLLMNLCRKTFNYQPGDEILILTNNPTTLQSRSVGPFTISQVHTISIITFHQTSHIVEQINICQFNPHWH